MVDRGGYEFGSEEGQGESGGLCNPLCSPNFILRHFHHLTHILFFIYFHNMSRESFFEADAGCWGWGVFGEGERNMAQSFMETYSVSTDHGGRYVAQRGIRILSIKIRLIFDFFFGLVTHSVCTPISGGNACPMYLRMYTINFPFNTLPKRHCPSYRCTLLLPVALTGMDWLDMYSKIFLGEVGLWFIR